MIYLVLKNGVQLRYLVYTKQGLAQLVVIRTVILLQPQTQGGIMLLTVTQAPREAGIQITELMGQHKGKA